MAVSPDPVIQYYNVVARYPANNQQWWLARSSTDDDTKGLKVGDFMPELLQKLYMGDMHAPRGHYVLDAFNKDRSTISGIPSLAVETIDQRPTSVAFFSGRVWFACNSTVYFGQVMTTKIQAGKCYMDADPTSENISDPVETDGGVIPIPEAIQINRLLAHSGGILVFAKNGVWFITGTSQGFSALDISVNKVSPVGCNAPRSVVETESSVFWWSDIGIMGIQQGQNGQFGPVNSNMSSLNISEPTIHSFYNAISDEVRSGALGLYDGKTNVLYWLYRSETTPSTQYDRVLCLDLGLGAFYPWQFSQADGGPVIKGFYINPDRNNSYSVPTDIRPCQVEYITLTRGSPTSSLRIAQVRSGQFVDWYSYNNVGVTYSSYVETGYELFNDSMRRKNLVYLYTYLTRTETSFVGDTPDFPSSCYLTIKWDWATGAASNQETPALKPINVYRRLLLGAADTAYGMIVNKLKVRGNGKAIQFRFETSDAGKNFDLNGWAVEVSGEPVP